MNQIRSGNGATAAVLAGSLDAFGLLDVLRLLCRTRHSGEMQVVGDGVEAHLWVDGGDLLDRSGAAADRLFELACLDDAWFTVTAVPTDHGADGASRVALGPLVEHVAPQVAEWHALVQALPFGAVARMSPTMPTSEIQIRADQWRILSLIGAGRPVHEVVDVSDTRPLETLRVVRELADEHLISVEAPRGDPSTGRRPQHSQRARVPEPQPDGSPQRQAPEQPVPRPRPASVPASQADHPAGRRSSEGTKAGAEREVPAGADGAPVEPMRLLAVGVQPGGATSLRRSTGSVTAPADRPTARPSGRDANGARTGPGTTGGAGAGPAHDGARPAVCMPPPLVPGMWPHADAVQATAAPDVGP